MTGLTLLLIKRRATTRFQLTESSYAAQPTPARRNLAAKSGSREWIPPNQLDDVTLSGPRKRWTLELLPRRT
jgi:A/G-specific adenine glycosylase